MILSQLCKGLLAAAIMVVASAAYQPVQAACGVGCDKSASSQCCPQCKYVCKLEAKMEDVDKTCFEVESKTICIPRVVFPWQLPKKSKGCNSCDSCDGRGCSTCVNNGARTRTIRVLKTKKYKCPECKYTWTAEKKGGCGCGGNCSGGGCASSGCAGDACRGCASCDTNIYASPVPVHQPMPAEGYQAVPAESYQPMPAEHYHSVSAQQYQINTEPAVVDAAVAVPQPMPHSDAAIHSQSDYSAATGKGELTPALVE